ncbi:MAG TPA: hypothetical protein PKM25_14745 [Candidatus Ozemobacteraceae bacterium]|nr:hypothetical protein [Candidatus Ozemobacteraceae bacterium]
MKYCWDVYNKSECDACPYFKSFKEGTLDLEKNFHVRDVVEVPETDTSPATSN